MKKLQSIERAMNILSILDFIGGRDGMGVNEIAGYVKLKVPTVHNFLQTLLVLGYLEQVKCKYRIAEKTQWLGWDGMRKENLIRRVKPLLTRLVCELNETSILVVRSGHYWQTLLKMESNHMLTAQSNLPMTENFYISATGRCILSQLSEAELHKLVTGFRLPLPEEWTDAETFEKMLIRLEKIKRDGYEIYETRNGISGVGAEIPPIEDAAEGALGIIVPSFRFQGRHREKILLKIREAARAVGEKC